MNERNRGNAGYERRKNADWMVKGATILSIISWILTISALLTLDVAAPTRENLFTHLMGGAERITWNEITLLITFSLIVISILSCIGAFIFNMLRMRRKTDKYKKSIIIIGLMTLVGFVVFMIRFGGVLF